MRILHRDNCYILVGRILLFVWDAHFYVGMSTLTVKTGKISLFAWDAYFHSGMPIFTVDLEIFVVKIFSWFAQTTKIKNTKYILQRDNHYSH